MNFDSGLQSRQELDTRVSQLSGGQISKSVGLGGAEVSKGL